MMKFDDKDQEDLFHMIRLIPLNVPFIGKDLEDIYSQEDTKDNDKESL